MSNAVGPVGGGRSGAAVGVPWKVVLGVAGVLAVVVAGRWLGVGEWFTVEELRARREALVGWREAHAVGAAVGFVGIYAAQTVVSLPGSLVLSLAGGMLFGPWVGTALVVVGATAGATGAAALARWVLRDAVERWVGERGRRVQEGFARDGLSYLLFLRFVPLFPFWLVNLAGGLSRISLGRYVVGTAVGILPATFVFTFTGSRLGALESVGDIVSPGMLLAFGMLGALALTPVALRRWRGRGRS